MENISRKKTIIALSIITVLNFVFHIINLSRPSRPVFDEAHFATYSADYINATPRFDIHPPLGKLLYAGVLLFSNKDKVGGANFINLQKGRGGGFTAASTGNDYGRFPYVRLRLFSALFGILLPLVIYSFLRSIGVGAGGSILGAALTALDSALLVQTRLILLDGMFLLWGFLALSLYFSNKNAWIAGAIWGLAISTKLTAAIFLSPILISFLISDKKIEEFKKGFKFFTTGAMIFLVIGIINFIYFAPPPEDLYLSTARKDGHFSGDSSKSRIFTQNLFLSVSNYVFDSGTSGAQPTKSSWSSWLFGRGEMVYYSGDGGSRIVLSGNMVIWLAVAFSVFCGLGKYIVKFLRGSWAGSRPETILLGGYIFSILPFIFLVKRSTFLYHYFPSLIFGIGLLAWAIEHCKFKKNAVILFIILAICGFVVNFGNIYGA